MRSNIRVVFYETITGVLFSHCCGLYAMQKDIAHPMALPNAWVGAYPLLPDMAICHVPLELVDPAQREQHFNFWGVIQVDVDPALHQTRRKGAQLVQDIIYHGMSPDEAHYREVSGEYYVALSWARQENLPPPPIPPLLERYPSVHVYRKALEQGAVIIESTDSTDERNKIIMSINDQLKQFSETLGLLGSITTGLIEAFDKEATAGAVATVSTPAITPGEAPLVANLTPVSMVEIPEPEEEELPDLPAGVVVPKSFITNTAAKAGGVADGLILLREQAYGLLNYNQGFGILDNFGLDVLTPVDLPTIISSLDALYEAINLSADRKTSPTVSKTQKESYNGYLRNLSNALTFQLSTIKKAGYLNDATKPLEYVELSKNFKELINVVLNDLAEWRKDSPMGMVI